MPSSDNSAVGAYVAGALGGAAGVVVGHPFDTTKVQMQIHKGKPTTTGTIAYIREQGWVGLAASARLEMRLLLTYPVTGMLCLLLCLGAVLAAGGGDGATPTIHAPWGTIQGVGVDGDDGRRMSGYLGIPYAKAPIGDLRFEKPVPHPGPGEGEVFVADRIMPPCPQMPYLLGTKRQTSEDCLMLNVFTPLGAQESAQPYPVMVFIHGGGFSLGDATFYRPSKLVVDEDTIVVVIQYRLGALGFFSTGDGSVKGNQGLWDQIQALHWVQENIAAFRGDPDTVTIFGESAGSMSVGLLMFSPAAKGLFKRAIMQSGSPQSISHLTQVFDPKKVFGEVADLFDCPKSSVAEAFECVKKVETEEYFNKTAEYQKTSPFTAYFFPNVDGDFIPEDLKKLSLDDQFIRENGIDKIDVIMGVNNKEGSLVLMMLDMLDLPAETLYSVDFFYQYTQMCFLFNFYPADNGLLNKTVDFFYRGADAGTTTPVSMDAITDMYGDCLLGAAILDWMRYLVVAPHSGRRYLYLMDHDFDFNRGPVPGSHHGDELLLQFDFDVNKDLFKDTVFERLNKSAIKLPEEKALAAKFNKMFTSFARNGDPNPAIQADIGGEWPEFTVEREAYLSVSTRPRVVEKLGPYRDRTALWITHLPEMATFITEQPKGEQPSGADAKEEL